MTLTPIYLIPGHHGTDPHDVNTMPHTYYKADEVRAWLKDKRDRCMGDPQGPDWRVYQDLLQEISHE